ncbi:hypothetical protein M9H77_03437 [Catharanthus roseus]|uniref:Uncharacterized protein n=1 Tax=Catharanthus roseus TaxID=4058 RepID=A0ACC0CBF8_CATRO|nr:hypothetical protein M9H77_03437 [Catharanthus roseus]
MLYDRLVESFFSNDLEVFTSGYPFPVGSKKAFSDIEFSQACICGAMSRKKSTKTVNPVQENSQLFYTSRVFLVESVLTHFAHCTVESLQTLQGSPLVCGYMDLNSPQSSTLLNPNTAEISSTLQSSLSKQAV